MVEYAQWIVIFDGYHRIAYIQVRRREQWDYGDEALSITRILPHMLLIRLQQQYYCSNMPLRFGINLEFAEGIDSAFGQFGNIFFGKGNSSHYVCATVSVVNTTST